MHTPYFESSERVIYKQLQAKKYKNRDYKHEIKKTLNARDQIKEILDKHRTSDLPTDWMPVSIYCSSCNSDKVSEIKVINNIVNFALPHLM